MQNILTIDLEDWFQAQSYRSKIEIRDWDKTESRLRNNTLEILNILRQFNTKATFFVLAYNARRHPDIIQLIKEEGHELGLHGYYHNLVSHQSYSEFKNEIDASKKILEDMAQTKVIGFRAPCWSITKSCLWALDILFQMGFFYDSSMDESIFQKYVEKIPLGLLEVPRSEFRIFNLSFPSGGGFFLRAYPYSLTKYFIQQKNKRGKKNVVYLHPWEIDRSPLAIKPYFPRTIIYHFGLNSTRRKLCALLRDFKFNSIKNIYFTTDNTTDSNRTIDEI